MTTFAVSPDEFDDIADVVEAVLGERPLSLVRVPSFAGNRVFRVTGADGARFFKFGARADIAREHAALQIASAEGIPVPSVEATDLDGSWSPHALIVLADAGGKPLAGSEADIPRLRDLMARWHAVGLDGFGTAIADRRGHLHGEHQTWLEALHARAAGARAAASAGLVDADLIDGVTDAVRRTSSLLTADSGRLLHGDFHPRHVYADGETITAVIDWGDATVGDPDYDLARLVHVGLLSGKPPVEGLRLTKVLVYAAVFVCWSMAGELEGGAPWPPWWPEQSARLAWLLRAIDDSHAR